MLDFYEYERIHFIGIGGVSMKALALYAAHGGHVVTGSDAVNSPTLAALRGKGIGAYVGIDTSVVANADLVVFSASIKCDNPELAFARANKIACAERKVFLAAAAATCGKCVAVAGTHGKTSVTAMLCHAMEPMGIVGHIGGDLPECESNLIESGKNFFVTEACEYNRSFLCLETDVAVVLNCDYDHPDSYATPEETYGAYAQFLERIRSGGCAVVSREVRQRLPRTAFASLEARGVKVKTFGYDGEDYGAAAISFENGLYSYDACENGVSQGRVKVGMYGKHNVLNSLAAYAAARECGLEPIDFIERAQSFCGVRRRFECKGLSRGGARIISDYAHHPREIAAAVDTARVLTKGKIIALFEPHTYSRTKALLGDFADSFYWIDSLALLPTFAAREKPADGASAYELCLEVLRRGGAAVYLSDYGEAEEYVAKEAHAGDIVLLLGAGNIDKLAAKLVET